MPVPISDEIKLDYAQRCVAWGNEQQLPLTEVLACIRIKWQAIVINQLLEDIERGEPVALRRAVVLLLKDNYLP